MQVTPCVRSSRSKSNKFSLSSSFSAAVGSSRISSLTFLLKHLGDLDQLLLASAQILHFGGRIDAEPDLLQHLIGLPDGLVPVHQEATLISCPKKMFS